MYTEYNSQNVSNNQFINSENIQKNNKKNDKKEPIDTNKLFKFISKILLVLIVFVVLFLGLIQFKIISFKSDILPETVIISQKEIGIKKGRGYQLVATVLPENASNKKVVYESSDPSVATVNEITGYVTALKNGTTTIKVKTLINNKEAECVINVDNYNIPINSINILDENINIGVGYTDTIKYRVAPSNANQLNFNFTSSDPNIAKVDANGVITGVKSGNAVIKISANNNTVVDTANVVVYKKGTTIVVNGESVKSEQFPKSIRIPSEKNLAIDSTVQLEALLTPQKSINILNWYSTNPSVATVNSSGLVKAINVGQTDIIVKTINNLTSICHVKVGTYSIKLKNISINNKIDLLPVGTSEKLYVSYEPVNASNPTMIWSSDNQEVAEINQDGVVTAKTKGTATITVTSAEGSLSDSFKVQVDEVKNIVTVSSLSLGKAQRDIYIGSTEQITPIFTPTNATYKSVTYSSSDPNVATVNENGLVTGVSEGKSTITVKTNYEKISASLIINVKNNPSTSVELDKTSMTIRQNETDSINAVVKPTNASDKTVTYKSEDPTIAVVDQSGLVTGIKKGTTTITVTPNGGGSSSTCLINVK